MRLRRSEDVQRLQSRTAQNRARKQHHVEDKTAENMLAEKSNELGDTQKELDIVLKLKRQVDASCVEPENSRQEGGEVQEALDCSASRGPCRVSAHTKIDCLLRGVGGGCCAFCMPEFPQKAQSTPHITAPAHSQGRGPEHNSLKTYCFHAVCFPQEVAVVRQTPSGQMTTNMLASAHPCLHAVAGAMCGSSFLALRCFHTLLHSLRYPPVVNSMCG